MGQPVKIAYLAPEIPGLSSTFVYNEIFVLQKQGFSIDTFSVHPCNINEPSAKLKALQEQTLYLYESSLSNIVKANITCAITRPLRYAKVLGASIVDMFGLLSTPNTALGMLYRFFYGVLLANELKRKNITHLHIHFAHVPADIGMYASMLANVPYSVTAHANDIFDRTWLLKKKVKRSKFFGTISEFNVRWFKKLGADISKMHIVRCGVDSSAFSTRQSRAKSKPVTFGFLGRLVEKKGAHVLIEACSKMTGHRDNFIIELVGDGPLLGDLQQAAYRYDLQNCVRFLGTKPHNEIANWLEQLDYFILPCVKDSRGDMDGIPVALMEAMLKGVPVISTDVSGIPELVKHSETGLIVQTNDADALATTILAAISEPSDLCLQRIRNAEHLVQSEYDLTKNAHKLGQLILF